LQLCFTTSHSFFSSIFVYFCAGFSLSSELIKSFQSFIAETHSFQQQFSFACFLLCFFAYKREETTSFSSSSSVVVISKEMMMKKKKRIESGKNKHERHHKTWVVIFQILTAYMTDKCSKKNLDMLKMKSFLILFPSESFYFHFSLQFSFHTKLIHLKAWKVKWNCQTIICTICIICFLDVLFVWFISHFTSLIVVQQNNKMNEYKTFICIYEWKRKKIVENETEKLKKKSNFQVLVFRKNR
jgi:hypothetical protein